MKTSTEMVSALLNWLNDNRVMCSDPPTEAVIAAFASALDDVSDEQIIATKAAEQHLLFMEIVGARVAKLVQQTRREIEDFGRECAGIIRTSEGDLHQAQSRISELERLVPADRRMHPISDPTVRDAVWTLTQGKCAYCDTEIKRDGQAETRGVAFCVEHVVPTSAGGPDNLANYVPACISCNSSKGDRHVLMLLRRMQRRTDLVVVAENGKAVS
jgi:5-methylcytosine-specific restriction endonuclease McrA